MPLLKHLSVLLLAFISPKTLGASESTADILDFLIAQNENARQMISSAHYIFEFENTVEREKNSIFPSRIKGTTEVLQRGNWRRINQDKSTTHEGEDKCDKTLSSRTVINDNYCTVWLTSNMMARQYDHESIESITDQHRLILETHSSYDPMVYGFGNGRSYISEAKASLFQDNITITRQKSPDGQTVFRIDCFSPSQQDRITTTYVIDPNKGFLVTQIVAYAQDGSIGMVQNVTPRKIEPESVWFPGEIEEIFYCGWPKTGRSSEDVAGASIPGMQRHLRISIKDIEVNSTIDPDQFMTETLGLPERALLLRQKINGESEVYVCRNGQFIPADIERELRHGEEHLESLPEDFREKPSTSNLDKSLIHAPAQQSSRVGGYVEMESHSPPQSRTAWTGGIAIFTVSAIIYGYCVRRKRGAKT